MEGRIPGCRLEVWRKHTMPSTQKGELGAPQTSRSPRTGSSRVEGSLPSHSTSAAATPVPTPQEEQWDSKWCPHLMWVTVHGSAPGGGAQAATHNWPTPRPPAAWPEDLASPQEDPNDDTHRAGFFLKQIPLASVCDEFFAGNRVFLNFLECL